MFILEFAQKINKCINICIKHNRFMWHIMVQRGLYVELTFIHFDVYENPVLECNGDVIIITDFNLQNISSVIARYVHTFCYIPINN